MVFTGRGCDRGCPKGFREGFKRVLRLFITACQKGLTIVAKTCSKAGA